VIIIADYGAGNLGSLTSALLELELDFQVSAIPEDVALADRLIIPGVGAFRPGMENLRKSGLDEAIINHHKSGKPIVGICLGMHLMATKGTEGGETAGLGILSGKIERLEASKSHLVPHLGWEEISELDWGHDYQPYVYFAHSYYFSPESSSSMKLSFFAWDGYHLPAIVKKENATAFQFHPEKSGQDGLILLRNALET
jgi:imidazole glycerol-phosphate synthase subunit HisH